MKNQIYLTHLFLLVLPLLFFTGCSGNKSLSVNYLKEGKLTSVIIPLDFIDESGNIISPYIDTVIFTYLDSLCFEDMNPDRQTVHSTPAALNFKQKIKPYSPEYYMAYTVHNVIKAIEYYNGLFDNKIDFNYQTGHKSLEVSIGDVPFLTTPKTFVIEEGSNPSPSLFFHEVGYRAFWYIESGLGVKFGGLSYIHMGLLEYYTVSLNDSPTVGEDALPSKTIRNASWIYSYPVADSLSVGYLFKLLKESYPGQIQDSTSNIARYYNTAMTGYKDYMHIVDNHRGGMIITSTLWRIRQQLGQDKTDRLVTRTILNLNSDMAQRDNFYRPSPEEVLPERIEWYDLLYGLMRQDKELYEGKNSEIIIDEFAKTGFNVDKIKI